MFTIYTKTDTMVSQGINYHCSVSHGTKKRMMEWFDVLSRIPETVSCYVVRDKDHAKMAEYIRE